MSSVVLRSGVRSARWVFDCSGWKPTESEWLRVASGVQEDEKARIGRFVFRRDAKYSMAGRLMMRKFIVESTGLSWRSVCIARDENNKPVFPGSQVRFNVSHQGDYAVLAGESGVEMVGVDVMKVEYLGGKPVSEFFRIMNRQFSEDEWSVIRSQETEWDKLRHFYRFWCLKESYVKATGTGITVDLRQISFKVNSPLSVSELVDDTELFLRGVKQTDWTFEEAMIDGEHCCAVATSVPRADRLSDPDRVARFSLLHFQELVENLESVTAPDVGYCRAFLAKEEAPF